jgi:hypothetical protein
MAALVQFCRALTMMVWILRFAGYEVQNATSGEALRLPTHWDQHSANGLFTASYKNKHDASITFNLQVRLAGRKTRISN